LGLPILQCSMNTTAAAIKILSTKDSIPFIFAFAGVLYICLPIH
jgi:hypothetical protein